MANKSESKIRRDKEGNRLNRFGKIWQKPERRFTQVAKHSHPTYSQAHGHCQMISSQDIEAFEQDKKRSRIRRRQNGFDLLILERIQKKEEDEQSIPKHVG